MTSHLYKENIKKIISKFPEKVPIIFLPSKNLKNTKNIKIQKFIMPKSLIMSEVIYTLRKKLNLNSYEAIFIFTGKNQEIIPSPNSLVSEIYELYKSEDDILYITYTNENVFG
jgi:GABA(A) receptor-associated protein